MGRDEAMAIKQENYCLGFRVGFGNFSYHREEDQVRASRTLNFRLGGSSIRSSELKGLWWERAGLSV